MTIPANLSPIEIEALIQEARDAGFTAGYRAGLQDGPYCLPAPVVAAFFAEHKDRAAYYEMYYGVRQYASDALYSVLRDIIIPGSDE